MSLTQATVTACDDGIDQRAAISVHDISSFFLFAYSTANNTAPTWLQTSLVPAIHVQWAVDMLPSDATIHHTSSGLARVLCECFT